MSTVVTLVGIALAAFIFLGSREKAAALARMMNVFGLYSLSYGKFFFDPLYNALVVWPLLGIARLAAWFDRWVIDGLVDFFGWVPALLGRGLAAGAKRPDPVLRPGDGARAVGHVGIVVDVTCGKSC